MSATFKNAKKKLSQTELRKIMNQHKGKAQKDVKKIDSPLAKYNEQGQLTCILCKSVVRSEAVWTIHINAKQHKQNVDLAKKLKERTNNFTKPIKRALTPPIVIEEEVPEKKPRGILKNSTSKPEDVGSSNGLPNDFFDTSKPNKSNAIPKTTAKIVEQEKMEIEEDNSELPEGFFDDPKLDAKARHQEYKDPVEEEWDKFLKVIKEADNQSNAIIAEDQEESTAERQIDEIDEQMKHLSKVLEFEKKKEEVITVTSDLKPLEKMDEENDEAEDEFDEYLDWRSKKSFK